MQNTFKTHRILTKSQKNEEDRKFTKLRQQYKIRKIKKKKLRQNEEHHTKPTNKDIIENEEHQENHRV